MASAGPVRPMEQVRGVPASPGVVVGKAFIIASERLEIPRRSISEEEVPEELARFERALAKTTQEILEVRRRLAERIDEEHAHILDAHLLVLEDVQLIQETMQLVKTEKVNVEYAFSRTLESLATQLSSIEDEYIRERANDIRDIGRRVLRALLGKERRSLAELEEEVVVVAYDLSPADTALMHRERVIGFATDVGSRTSHTAIMARSLEIPAVVGLKDITQRVRRGDLVIVDGDEGVVVINPDEETLVRYRSRLERLRAFERELAQLKDLPAETLDGFRVTLAANIELPEEIPSVLAHGAEGIGLFRTEYLYLNRADLPSEEEQYQAYRLAAEKMAPNPTVVRTLDLGGDKFMSALDVPREMNPFLGCRAIRFCLERPDIFRAQVRAILRASAHGNLKMMFPLISSLGELEEALALVESCKEELRREGKPFRESMEVGAMIETPAAAVIADVLAERVDFFSIGSNDLIQYALAIDRVNEKIAHLYDPAHPAVLRLIRSVVEAGHARGIWVGMCGEMAGELPLIPLLLGMGLDELSMSVVALPRVKKLIRSVRRSECEELLEEAMSKRTGREVQELACGFVRERLPQLVC